MPLFPTRRRSGPLRGLLGSPLLVGGSCFIAATILLLAYVHYNISASTYQLSRLQAGAGVSTIPRLSSLDKLWRLAIHGSTTDKFATLFHLELAERFKLTESKDVAQMDAFISTLKSMESVGITTVMFSTPWEYFQPAEGQLRKDYLDMLIHSVCNTTRMKVALILDMVRAPDWVFNKWPDAKAMDSHGRQYALLSWFHSEANKLALDVLRTTVSYVVSSAPSCVTAVQPAYNNEYEAKYTQEHDCFQDYSIPAITSFRSWLQQRRPELPDLNDRWSSNFTAWGEVAPPVLEAGSFMGIDLSPRYWDFLKFREKFGADVLNAACAAVRSVPGPAVGGGHGSAVRCFHRAPEFFTVLDAVYGASLFPLIAASPTTDFIVVDSNFFTPYGSVMNPAKLRLFVSAALSYGKPVHLGVTLQRGATDEHLAAGFRQGLLAGADGVGLTNWLPHVTLNASLAGAMSPGLPPPCPTAAKLVGLFLHLESCMAWHGLQWEGPSKDPLHEFVQTLADKLTAKCDSVVAVYLGFDTLLAAMPALDKVIFVEPLVLYSGPELEGYSAVKAALSRKAHDIMQMPHSHPHGVDITVMQAL